MVLKQLKEILVIKVVILCIKYPILIIILLLEVVKELVKIIIKYKINMIKIFNIIGKENHIHEYISINDLFIFIELVNINIICSYDI
jgi:hypothetical protein